ncbi:MAG: glutathione binding-like protein [Polyangiaceae bacterium]
MELFFAPMACSLATRIALSEAGAEATFTEVDTRTATTTDGRDYLAINPLGLVPALRTDEGVILTENVAILAYVAERTGTLTPSDEAGRQRMLQWLSFVSTELHCRLFGWQFDPAAPTEIKAHAVEKGKSRLDYLERHLDGRDCVLDEFSVVDAYLTTVLNWAQATPVDLSAWPAIGAYLDRMRARPSVAASIAVELPLYLTERERHRAASA